MYDCTNKETKFNNWKAIPRVCGNCLNRTLVITNSARLNRTIVCQYQARLRYIRKSGPKREVKVDDALVDGEDIIRRERYSRMKMASGKPMTYKANVIATGIKYNR